MGTRKGEMINSGRKRQGRKEATGSCGGVPTSRRGRGVRMEKPIVNNEAAQMHEEDGNRDSLRTFGRRE